MPSNLFLKIKSIPGSSQVKGMETTSELLSFQYGATVSISSQASGKGETAGHPSFSDISVMKHPDKASPLLFANMTSGKRLTDDVEFFVQKMVDGSSQTFYHVKLQGVIVSSFTAAASDDVPVESITFNYQKIIFSFADEDKGKLA